MVLALSVLAWAGCDRVEPGSPEAVADAFVDAYFRRADQVKAKEYTAFGATKLLDAEIAQVKQVRQSGYTPTDASIDVAAERGERSMRGERVRFDYVIRYKGRDGEQRKHADIELAEVQGQWKVVRIALSNNPAPAAS